MSIRIGLFICRAHQLLDLAGPLDVFQGANRVCDRALYDTTVLSLAGGPVTGSAGVPVHTRTLGEAPLDTLIVIGGMIEPLLERPAIETVLSKAAEVERVASVCTGAFLLAEAGLLDGRRATTHWRFAPELQRGYPKVRVQPDRIFVADGPVWTSAGITAGIDLALALVEADHGPVFARNVARDLVVYHRRTGGQSQFSALSRMEPESDRIRTVLGFIREHLPESLPTARLAEAARLSERQFGRAFRRETGETPARAVERLRTEAARERLREGSEPMETIARAVGFNDPERMRRAFVKLYGRPPQALRRMDREEG